LTPHVAAQNPPLGFAEIAADAAAARDVNDTPRAVQLYTQALQLDPKWQDGWWWLGLLQYGSGAYAHAIDAFSRLVALNPSTGQGFALRGLCEFETGDYTQALDDIRKGRALEDLRDPRQQQILRYHEAMLLTRLRKFQDALKMYSAFAEHKVSNPELLVAIGLAGLRLPLLPKEAPSEQRALLTAAGEATYKFMQGDESAARQAFDNLFQRFPNVKNEHYLYGDLLLAFGPDSAAPQFKKELEVAPDNQDALTMLAWSLLMDGRADAALPYAKRLAQAEPEVAATHLILGRALVDTGDATAGIEHLEHALKIEPNNLEIHIALAKAYSKSGRDDESRRERALCLQLSRSDVTQLAHP
jgi:tetratricopeptide (TPR) repeat protein